MSAEGKEDEAQEYLCTLIGSIQGKQLAKANPDAANATEVQDPVNKLAKVAAGQLQGILCSKSKRSRKN